MRWKSLLTALLVVAIGCNGTSPSKDDPRDYAAERFVSEIVLVSGGDLAPQPDPAPAPKPDGRVKCDQCVNGKVGDGRTFVDCQKCGGDGWIDPDDAQSLPSASDGLPPTTEEKPPEKTVDQKLADVQAALTAHIDSQTAKLSERIDGFETKWSETLTTKMQEMRQLASAEPEPVPDPWASVPDQVMQQIVEQAAKAASAKVIEEMKTTKPQLSMQVPKAAVKKIEMYTRPNCSVCDRWKREVAPVLEKEGWIVEYKKDTTNVPVPYFQLCNGNRCHRHDGFISRDSVVALAKQLGI